MRFSSHYLLPDVNRSKNVMLSCCHFLVAQIRTYSFSFTDGSSNMDVDESLDPEVIKLSEMIDFLIANENICFKNQSREEIDLNDAEKFNIANEIYCKSKPNFLLRFGKYLEQDHLNHFKSSLDSSISSEETEEIKMILDGLTRFHAKGDPRLKTKNRRYEALNKLIKENSYFSENEMMKRNPLLYDQLIGQYLSEEERKERDMHIEKDTLVKILLEGIERDLTEDVFKQQLREEEEDQQKEEEAQPKEDEEDFISKPEDDDNNFSKSFKWGEFHDEPSPSTSKWGELPSIKPKRSTPKLKNPITKKKAILQKDSHFITAEERRLLKEEFTTIMHQNFLNGKDDFDYTTVDNNDEYDNIEILGHDEEDKYFDSEEPEQLEMEDDQAKVVSESSEDELDIYMNALNQHPTVLLLSKDLEKL